jgi:signal transduction histidine kinase
MSGVSVAVILLVTFYLVFHSSSQAAGRNTWVAHSYEVLTIISRARLEPTNLQNQVWAYRSSHDAELPRRFALYVKSLRADLQHLRELTADNTAQQLALTELTPVLVNQMSSLEQAMQRATSSPDERTELAFDWALRTPLSDRVQGLFETLESNERKLLAMRSSAVRDNLDRTNLILLAAAMLTFAVLAFAGQLVSRELMIHAQLQEGISAAQGLLGVKYEEQGSELGLAMKDLHSQIRKRQRVESELQLLNVELEERVKSRTVELQEANRELETFNYAVSHDLRAPLRHMNGFSHFLEKKYGPGLPEEAQHYLNRIRSAATHMSRLVEGLLQLSHIGRQLPNITQGSLDQVLDDARAELLPECAGRQIDWRVGPLPEVNGDIVLLGQVFTNLLSNAIKFTRLQDHPIIEIGTCQEKGATAIFVRDNGAGFNTQFADKLFGVFQRLHRADEFEGTGIGLATVQRIVHRHGGRIWAESEPGKGATFFFTLPFSPAIVPRQELLIGAPA